MLLRDVEREEIEIIVKYEISEEEKFNEAIANSCKRVLARGAEKRNDQKNSGGEVKTDFQIMFKELEKVSFQINYYQKNLLKKLNIPALIITDLDINRPEKKKKDDGIEKGVEKKQDDYPQIKTLKGQKTSNKTIKYFHKAYSLTNIKPYMLEDNIYIAYQKKIGEYYPTSFEEAFILTNAENNLLNNVLKKVKPQIYKDIVGSGKKADLNQNREQSYKWQAKLSNEKGKFASELLYALIVEKDSEKRPELPNYIKEGLDWLGGKLEEDGRNGITGD